MNLCSSNRNEWTFWQQNVQKQTSSIKTIVYGYLHYNKYQYFSILLR